MSYHIIFKTYCYSFRRGEIIVLRIDTYALLSIISLYFIRSNRFEQSHDM